MPKISALSPDLPDPPGMKTLQFLVASDMIRIDDRIAENLQSDIPLIAHVAQHITQSGGKRIRPMIMVATAHACGYTTGDRHINLATSVEFIHTATLLHDDVVDESALRRGRATAHTQWGNKASILVGDFLFTRAFQLMVADGSLEILTILSEASRVIAEGEVQQLMMQRDLDITEAFYFQMISAKTASLFSAAAQVGAVIAGVDDVMEQAMKVYGESLGMAFQLTDDALDYRARQASLGKTVGDDFTEGKITLPVLKCYHQGSDTEKAFWRRTIGQGHIENGDLAYAVTLMQQYHAFEETLDMAKIYGKKAKSSLDVLPPSAMRSALRELVDFCIERAY